MPILARDASLPVFSSVEKRASLRINELVDERKLPFSRYVVVTGNGPVRILSQTILKALAGQIKVVHVSASSTEEVERTRHTLKTFQPDAVIGIGGGKSLDVAKCAAFKNGLPFLSVPTAVTNDGIASPISVIRFGDRTRSLMTHSPVAVIADLDIISRAPARTLRSGIGDVTANLSACADWQLAYHRKKEFIDSFAETLARHCAMRAVEAGNRRTQPEQFLRVLIESLILSGIAMAVSGSSRPCSGAEHMISHALDRHFGHPASHGEQTGLATLFTLSLHGQDTTDIRSFFEKFSLPQRPEDIGLSKTRFLEAVFLAPHTRRGRYSVLNETGRSRMAEAYERAYA